MIKNALKSIDGYVKQRRQIKRWQKIVTCLAAVVVFVTTYALILPAITMEDETFCGYEDHQHSAENGCYEQKLICQLSEGDAHVHTSECYTKEKTLICGLTERPSHTHTDNCIQTELILICEDASSEHEHSDECYQEIQTYLCGQEESSGHTHNDTCYETMDILTCERLEDEPHAHTEECYEQVLVCVKPEHTHTLICYSDQNADLETAAKWEKTLENVELTGDWAEDIVAIANSQLGYIESERNYTVIKSEDGAETKKGYSRYGAWYGDSYGDWCAMFVSFCLHYADADEFPAEANCQRWVTRFETDEVWESAASYIPGRGDLLFFDYTQGGTAQHVAIVEEYDEEIQTVHTIEGNSSDMVARREYALEDSSIMGYCSMAAAIQKYAGEDYTVYLQAAEGPLDFEDFLTKLEISIQKQGETGWTKTGDTSITVAEGDNLRFDFAYSLPKGTLSETANTLVYQIPEQLKIENSQTGPIYFSGEKIGIWTIADGKMTLQFDEKAIEKNKTNPIVGNVSMEVSVNKIDIKDGETVPIKFKDDLTIQITRRDEEKAPDLSVRKQAVRIDPEKGTIKWKINVWSANGTGGQPVGLKDLMDKNYFEGGTITVTNLNDETKKYEYAIPSGVNFDIGKLPALEPDGQYVITYTSKLTDEAKKEDHLVAKNTITATAGQLRDTDTAQAVFDGMVAKSGWTENDGKVHWRIKLNPFKDDISGWQLSDMLNGASFEGKVTIRDSKGTTKTVFLPYTFPAGSKDTYEITYETDKIPGSSNPGTQTNTATLTPPKGQGNPKTDTATAYQATFDPLSKECVSVNYANGNGETIDCKWRLTVSTKDKNGTYLGSIPGPWTVKDLLQNGMWYTTDQRAGIEEALKELNRSYTIKWFKDGGETVTDPKQNPNDKITGFEVTFTDELKDGEEIVLSFYSTAKIDDPDKAQSFSNDALFGEIKHWGTATYNPILTKKDVLKSGAETQHELKKLPAMNGHDHVVQWLITINPTGYKGKGNHMTLIEHLPEGLELAYLEILPDGVFGAQEITPSNFPADANHPVNQYGVNAEQNGQDITITMPEKLLNAGDGDKLKEIRILIRAVIKEDYKWTLDTDGTYGKTNEKEFAVFPNRCEILNNSQELGTAEQQQTIIRKNESEILHKSYHPDALEANVLYYSVKINEKGEMLLPDGQLRLYDEVTEGWAEPCVELLPGSVELYEMKPDGSRGVPLPPVLWTFTYQSEPVEPNSPNSPRKHKLTVNLPDGIPMILEYKYQIDDSEVDKWQNRDFTYNNVAWLDGFKNTDGTTEQTVHTKVYKVTASVKFVGVRVIKVQEGNYGITLPGAEFALYKWNAESEQYLEYYPEDDKGDPITLTTGENGELPTTLLLEENVAYKLVETKVPEGYSKGDDFYFYVSGDKDHPGNLQLPDGFNGVNLGEGSVIYYTNDKTTTDITVRKRWQDAVGNDITATQGGSVTFQLIQHMSAQGSAAGDMKITGSATPPNNYDTSEIGWSAAIENKFSPGTKLRITMTNTSKWGENDQTLKSLVIGGEDMIGAATKSVESISYQTYVSYTFDMTISPNAAKNVINAAGSGAYKFWSITKVEILSVPTVEAPGAEDRVYGEYTVGAEDHWMKTISNLPKKEVVDGVTRIYTYSIVETTQGDFEVSYSNNGGIEEGVITLTNKQNPGGYELPKTGGDGTKMFTIGGLALIAGCLLYGCVMRRKWERRIE